MEKTVTGRTENNRPNGKTEPALLDRASLDTITDALDIYRSIALVANQTAAVNRADHASRLVDRLALRQLQDKKLRDGQ